MLTHIEFRPEAIKELREKGGMSIGDFLKKTGHFVSSQSVSNWERGIDVPTLRSLMKIVNSFQVPLEFFFSLKLSSNDNGSLPQG